MLASQSTHRGQITHIPIATSRLGVEMGRWWWWWGCDEWWELGCGDQPNKRIFLARRMLFPKTVSPQKQRLAQIKVAVDSIFTPPSVIPHNLNIIFQPNFAHEIQKNSSKPKTCRNVFRNKTELAAAFQMA
jgi:hypothetical protein